METVINLLLSMQGGSLKKELYDAGISTTASAFVQKRDKIPWTVMQDIFEKFNSLCTDTKTYKGYLQRKRKVYYYEDVELTDKLLVEYIDTEAFTIYELEKIVGAIFVQRSKYKHKNVKMIKDKLCNII